MDVKVYPGSGQVVFTDVPIVPGSYPDTAPHPFAMKAPRNVKSSLFEYGCAASPWNVLGWYRDRLPKIGWHIEGVKGNTPLHGLVSILATRRGEALTVVIEAKGTATRVSLAKFVSTK